MELTVNKFRADIACFSEPDLYMILWMKKGFDEVKIDFQTFTAPANSIWFIAPGKEVQVSCKSEPQGWIIRFSKELFNTYIRENLVIKDVDLISSFGILPKIILSPKIGSRVHLITEMIDELSASEIPNRESAIASLLKTLLIYCDSKCNIRVDHENKSGKIRLVTKFKDLVDRNVETKHKVSDYASMLNISSKYLNQLVKEVMGVTAKKVIQEQLTIRARRELKFTNESIKEIAFKLGFSEPFHFSNYFKKQTGSSPSDFRLL